MPGESSGARKRGPNTARHRDVIVLDKDRVVEAPTMVGAAAAPHGIFFECPKSRSRLPRTSDTGLGMGDVSGECGGRGGNAGQMTEEIECNAFCAEHRP